MRIHIIAVGGRIMHTLALLLKEQGHEVSGSDDEIYEPSRSRLEEAGLLPKFMGWDDKRVNTDIELVILGMHARADNPELARAQEMGLKIESYPAFIYRMAEDKQRVVVAGSHGKTTTTAMIMHVLKYRNIDFDYVIGAELKGFNKMVHLSDAPLIIIEGDEYLSSSIDRRPKMLHYKPHLSVITGISWDHVNVFKTEDEYVDLFRDFIHSHGNDAEILYFDDNAQLSEIIKEDIDLKKTSAYYPLPKTENGNVIHDKKQYRIRVFGEHNRANMSAALEICKRLGITAPDFFAAISTFKGASKRLELLVDREDSKVYRDFAHAPSKVKATVQALKEHFPDKKIISFLELHTFSSLNKEFIPKYNGTLDLSDQAYVYFSSHTLEMKGLPHLSKDFVLDSFANHEIKIINEKDELKRILQELALENAVVVFMSSGNFDKIDVKGILIDK